MFFSPVMFSFKEKTRKFLLQVMKALNLSRMSNYGKHTGLSNCRTINVLCILNAEKEIDRKNKCIARYFRCVSQSTQSEYHETYNKAMQNSNLLICITAWVGRGGCRTNWDKYPNFHTIFLRIKWRKLAPIYLNFV